LLVLLASPALPTGRGPIFAPAPIEATDGLCSDVWNLPATDSRGFTYTCGEWIGFWKSKLGISLAAAKQFVADEIPVPCGPCAAGPPVVCTGDTTLEEALRKGCHTVRGDLIGGGASGDIFLPSLRYVYAWADASPGRSPHHCPPPALPHQCGRLYRGDISVTDNDKITSLTMDNLVYVDGSIRVWLNDNLASLTMPNLVNVDGVINVDYNDNLVDLTMTSLNYVGGGGIYTGPAIEVYGNNNLASLTMPNLGHVWGGIDVKPDPATCDLGPVYEGRDRYGFC